MICLPLTVMLIFLVSSFISFVTSSSDFPGTINVFSPLVFYFSFLIASLKPSTDTILMVLFSISNREPLCAGLISLSDTAYIVCLIIESRVSPSISMASVLRYCRKFRIFSCRHSYYLIVGFAAFYIDYILSSSFYIYFVLGSFLIMSEKALH